jgi:hypothetical protein
MAPTKADQHLDLRAGEIVEVRSSDEILATLDQNGRLDAMPFMPEMLAYCGKRFRVAKRADKTCDNIVKPWNMRRVENAVHLAGVRCDGAAHSACDAGCFIFWKEAWLKRADSEFLNPSPIATPGPSVRDTSSLAPPHPALCTLETLQKGARREAESLAAGEDVFTCQATELRNFTCNLPWWDFGQYVRDIRSGNLHRGLGTTRSDKFMEALLASIDILRVLLVSLVNKLQSFRGGLQYPHIQGALDAATPKEELGLQPGDFVQVKSREEIIATLDQRNRNRGLLFDSEMLRYCGGTFRVFKRVHKIVDEKTGKIMFMKSPCIILEGVACAADYHALCPRAIYHYWRENWLRRVP